jgi:Dihydrofolate reductase
MITGIVAVDRNGAIGKRGKLPWHYSADMKFEVQSLGGDVNEYFPRAVIKRLSKKS